MASFRQLPQVDNPRPQPISFGRAMGFLLAFFGLLWPRLTILAFWIFSDLLGDAYDGWAVPVAGFVLLPWTTMAYAVMWAVSSDSVAGAEWVVVGFAALADLITWAGARTLR